MVTVRNWDFNFEFMIAQPNPKNPLWNKPGETLFVKIIVAPETNTIWRAPKPLEPILQGSRLLGMRGGTSSKFFSDGESNFELDEAYKTWVIEQTVLA